MTAAVAARPKMRVFPGSGDQVRHARDFVRRTLAGFAAADDVLLLTSELVTNAVVHTASGAGGWFAVVVCRDGGRARIAVHDGGSVTTPAVRSVNGVEAESGFGLGLVAMLADRWGYDGAAQGRVVWFEVGA